ncbi:MULTISPECIES: hypothetical protein [Pseudomonas]|jgi:uncharacterized protein YdhG (YjbR/CyaY superfamily)|uniref:Uncharacterized protein n=1 Tax=Pseudomonas cucumis TaxID=2954082 RepID=A0ABY9ESJ8_9PSED|nr:MULTISPECIES: hypothetical protein [Pseudomonas]MDR8365611.1 hypothetical protein [Pseudomonas sp. JL3]URM30135.1 hypothetical protein LLY42_11550 [Pseudomonas frederiksbergensis]WLG83716.1 hypothetical protein PSH97_21835 [Pseudomonas cucumis]WLG89267.1 hypothetical protein PSH72_22355 [Pseudomonas cucumis]
MDETKLFASMLTQINENQLALRAAVEELSNWVAQQGAAEIADNVRCALQTLDANQDFISLALISISTDFQESQTPKRPDSNG